MAATYKDLQRETGLSLATISKYFNGGTVREANRVAIERAAKDLGYRLNELARSLRTRRTSSVGVVLPELHNDFHLAIIDGVEAVLSDLGIGVLVCSSRHDRPSTQTDAVGLLLNRQVDGIIAVATPRDHASLRSAARQDVPLVLVDRLVEELRCDAVVLDNRAASARAVQELTSWGHHRVGLLTGEHEVWTMRERLAGFRSEMAVAGHPVEEELLHRGPLTIDFGAAATRALLDSAAPPTAIFATNYELTLGALSVIGERGVRVPHDLSLVGFDGREIAGITSPRTSVLVQPIREIGMAAADLMWRRLGATQQRSPHTVVLAGEWVPGGSVAAPRPHPAS